jgi:hypothetical protein
LRCHDPQLEVDAGVPYTGNNTPDVFPIWLKEPANCGVTLDHVSVITKSAPNVYVTNAIRVAYGGPATITYAKVIGTQLGITIGPGTITDSYIVLGPTMRGDHNEDILETGGVSGLTIKPADVSLVSVYGLRRELQLRDRQQSAGRRRVHVLLRRWG